MTPDEYALLRTAITTAVRDGPLTPGQILQKLKDDKELRKNLTFEPNYYHVSKVIENEVQQGFITRGPATEEDILTYVSTDQKEGQKMKKCGLCGREYENVLAGADDHTPLEKLGHHFTLEPPAQEAEEAEDGHFNEAHVSLAVATRLREEIDFFKALLKKKDEELARRDSRIDEIAKAERKWRESALTCVSCSYIAHTIDDLRAHINECSAHPAWQTNRKLWAELKGVQEELAKAIQENPGFTREEISKINEVLSEHGAVFVGNPGILTDAARTVRERAAVYGHPAENWATICTFWDAYDAAAGRGNTTPRDLANKMILLKIARDAQNPKRDNHVDICGYIRAFEMIEEGRGGKD